MFYRLFTWPFLQVTTFAWMCIIDEQNIDTVNVAFIKLYLVNKEGLSTTDQKRYIRPTNAKHVGYELVMIMIIN